MSYILDALKKAERERGIAKVPTLETIHAAAPRAGNGRWAATFFTVVLLAAVTGLYLYSRSRPEPRHSSYEDIAMQNPPANSADAVPLETDAPQDQAKLQQRSPSPGAMPGKTPFEGTRGNSDPSKGGSGREGALSNAAAGYAPSAPAERDPYSRTPSADSSRTSAAQAPAYEAIEPTAADASPRRLPLSEALRDMQITIHLYSNVAENRKIFINGKKYAEGDYIDGTYLVESITPEGAVLSYEGNRAVIKASQ